MRTCNEIANYINQNGYYDKEADFSKSIDKIVEVLKENEAVVFAAGTRAISGRVNVMCQKAAVVVITNQRLIYAGKSAAMFSKNIFVKEVSLDFVSDSLYNQKSGGISIDCRDDLVVFWTAKDKVVEVFNKISSAIDNIKSAKNASASVEISSADEIKKYKELLDSGIISQEEFDAKKKQLLGL